MEFQRNPVDASLNVAIKLLARANNPGGWDQVAKFSDAPTSLETVLAYYKEHGKTCIAEEDSDGTIYDCADTNHHLRAWHDAVHIQYEFAFNAAGEAAATYTQIAQLVNAYGPNESTKYWAALLLADILGLVHYHQRTGLWPMDKRAWTIIEAEKWMMEGVALVELLGATPRPDRIQVAQARSRVKWGYPWEALA